MEIVDVKEIQENEEFEKFILGIKIESPEDAITLYSLFNHAQILESFKISQRNRVAIRKFIEAKYPNVTDEFVDFFVKANEDLRYAINLAS